jgi:hypothetical protein
MVTIARKPLKPIGLQYTDTLLREKMHITHYSAFAMFVNSEQTLDGIIASHWYATEPG